MVRQSRADISELLCHGRLKAALHRAEQILVDERRLSAYDRIESYCTYILQNFSHLQQQSDIHLLPDEMKETIAGLILAASRIGELIELQPIRSLFRQRFGSEFDKNNVELCPENMVDSEIKRILEEKTTMPTDTTPEALMEIAQSNQTDSSDGSPVDSNDSTDQNVKKIDKIQKLKTIVHRMVEKKRKKPKNENSQQVHTNLRFKID
ncbi:PREDICTED: uncharacterized protein LOC104810606 [Tarenaya hassleriana]|uniref:uncharacterized protein LOC104810606 n=1 Tax=Tarenaya hassleriana TaxID=28532 RepID=UPI00053C6994|nr:PREDICTED: uncharacterized protein LOC104810606 [Tarenaya hassleriana]